eukprot:5010665-Prymnesium_polylepis.1
MACSRATRTFGRATPAGGRATSRSLAISGSAAPTRASRALGNDNNCMSVVQYAVENLQVSHVIVCGHYDCGGVRAAMTNADHSSPLENWLRNVRDVYRLHRTELEAIEDVEARHRRLVELNVIEQCVNLYKTSVIQRRRRETFAKRDEYGYTQPRIHAMVYDPHDGTINRLKMNMAETLHEIRGIYDLFLEDDIEYKKR